MKNTHDITAPPMALTPERLGFQAVAGSRQSDSPAWQQTLRGRTITFRLLRSIEQLAVAEDLQRDVFGVTDYDLISAGELVVVNKTGGEVIAAFAIEDGLEQALGCLFGWGGFYDGQPRIVSDFMAVRKEARSAGIGAAMKRLQAAVALERGFAEIIWTVDPLRAANARLNFEKLGAYADTYVENLYGSGYGEAIYGDLPSDRIQVTWPIASPAVQSHLVADRRPRTIADFSGVAPFDVNKPDHAPALILIPHDIDQVRAQDPAAALDWRLRLRHELQAAFAAGLAITGFVSGIDAEQELSALVIERRSR
jgi:predicted GNAT superfamily acetyltransferase